MRKKFKKKKKKKSIDEWHEICAKKTRKNDQTIQNATVKEVRKMMKAFQCKKPKESSLQKNVKKNVQHQKLYESEDGAKRVIF